MTSLPRGGLLLTLLLASSPGFAQAPSAKKAEYVVGEITSLDAPARKVSVKTDAGTTIVAALAPNAEVVRAKPGSKTLADATPAALEDLAVGDRVMLHGFLDGTALDTRKVVLMTKGDIQQKQDAERAEWRKRGLVAVVASVDPTKNEVIARVGRRPDSPAVTLDVQKATFKRYAPNSVKFQDAKPSSLADLKPGDELRALGDRSPDGSRFTAEQVVTGAFRVFAGSVTSVNEGGGEVVFKEDESQKPVTVTVGPDARLRHLPAEMAARFGARRGAEDASPAPGGPASPPPDGAGRGFGAGAGAGGRRGFSAEDMLERFPVIHLADLKAGDRILVSSTKGDDPTKMTAIVLVSGLEAIPAAQVSRRGGRGTDVGLPGDLMDLGLSLQ
jgi:hypothetical protein